MLRVLAVPALLSLLGASALAAPQSVPPPHSSRLVDSGQFLSRTEHGAVAALLAKYPASAAIYPHVLTVESLSGEPIEVLGARVAEAWHLESGPESNVVLILVSVHDQEIRVQVPLEHPSISDAELSVVVERILLPSFARGDPVGGIGRALEFLVTAVHE